MADTEAAMVRTEPIELEDGRLLDLRIVGPEDGIPLVFHHGTPGAATPDRKSERTAIKHGFRLVTSSRAGYGGSTRNPGRRVVDVVGDTRQVLSHLGLDRCLVGGGSGGGPHALACGARLAGVAAVLVVAGVAPFGAEGLDWLAGMGEDNVAEFGAALEGETVLRPFLEALKEGLKGVTVEGVIAQMESLLPDVDKAVLTGEVGEDMLTSLAEAVRLGVDGWLDDDIAFAKPWGFELGEIQAPTRIWQGSADLMVPFAHGQWLAAHVPGAVAHLEEGEGHLSIGIGALGRMLDELAEIWGASS